MYKYSSRNIHPRTFQYKSAGSAPAQLQLCSTSQDSRMKLLTQTLLLCLALALAQRWVSMNSSTFSVNTKNRSLWPGVSNHAKLNNKKRNNLLHFYKVVKLKLQNISDSVSFSQQVSYKSWLFCYISIYEHIYPE